MHMARGVSDAGGAVANSSGSDADQVRGEPKQRPVHDHHGKDYGEHQPPLGAEASASAARQGLRHSVAALDGLREAQQALELPPVEPHHDLAVDDRHGCGLVPESLKLGQSRRVLADVLSRKRDPFLRKKLFLSLAAPSTRLGVDNHLLRHGILQ